MGWSSLIDGIELADDSNYSQDRGGQRICKITPHHMSGKLTGRQCARIFQNPNRNASANYCIGYDGDIILCVDENCRAWTSSNRNNDQQAITIECSNDQIGGEWHVSDATWNSLVALCVDICQRYDFRLEFNGNPSGSLTMHKMFANTDCPGPYLSSRFDELEATVNAILDGGNLELEDIVDLNLYKNLYPDLQQAFGDDMQKYWEHLCENGIAEGRRFSYVYDCWFYRGVYPDLQNAFGDDWWGYLNHYLENGCRENRQACKEFDSKYYRIKNADLTKFNAVDITKHFLAHGINEWRETSANFNVKNYRDRYQDLRNAFGNDCKKYYEHYIHYGQYEGRKCI